MGSDPGGRRMKCAAALSSLALLIGCTPAVQTRNEKVPIELNAEADGNQIILTFSVQPAKEICVNGHGLLPTTLDTYPDHQAEGEVVKITSDRSDVLTSYFSRDGSFSILEVWRNNGVSTIKIPEGTAAPKGPGHIELNIEMSQCSHLFSEMEKIDQYIYYKRIAVPSSSFR
ncbi:MAG: hypothetical protein LOY00_05285 [Methylocaldum sp.]|nr:hypothetical protein [Methylocaldum sp.]